MLDIKTLENWLWDAACKIRGEVDAPKYKDYILALIFLKRLSDVYDDEIANLSKEYEDAETAEKLVEKDHGLVWFYLPQKARWKNLSQQSTGVGEYLTSAVRSVARENPKLAGVIDGMDFNATTSGQRLISDEKLKLLIDKLGEHRLGLKDVEPDIIGRAYEYLLRKFAEGSGQSAGEFYTPKEVAILMAHIVDPEPGEEVYDPCLGSGGLLIKSYLRFKEKYHQDAKVKPLNFYGQEYIHTTYAMAKMNTFIHRMEANIALGDTMNKPAFTTGSGSLKKFDIVVANPMWNQPFPQSTYENDQYNRFVFGYPPSDSADWGWIQHMFASLKDKGRMAVVLDAMVVSRGSEKSNQDKERTIRQPFVKDDYVEAVIALPDNIFYNTTSQGLILIINKDKKHKNEILLIDATNMFEKRKPKNFLSENAITLISDIYSGWKEIPGISRIIPTELAVSNGFIYPPRYISKIEENHIEPKRLLRQLQILEELEKKSEKGLVNQLSALGNKHIRAIADVPKWRYATLGDIADFKLGRTPSRSELEYWKDGTIPWVCISDMTNFGYVAKTKERITKKALEDSFNGKVCKKGTLLMSFKLTIGRTAILDIDAVHNEAIISIEPKSDVNKFYLFYVLPMIDYTQYKDKAVKGHTLNKSKLASVKVPLPPLEEQNKIVDILRTIHNEKLLQERKLDTLDSLFKVMLQNFMNGRIDLSKEDK